MLSIHNTLTGRKTPLSPLEAAHVRLYVCGITAYDYCHLGHARAMIVFDTVVRYLRASGYRVTFVRNVTDIDDKIIARAAETGEPAQDLAQRFTVAMQEDCAALGLAAPNREPRATEHVGDMIAMIQRLLDVGAAYTHGNGDVYYAVNTFADYGRLSGRVLDELRAGDRVAVNEAKRDPLDFVLWKAAKPDEPAWPAPWGAGRPGWHIECSAMSARFLGETFDIHGGGADLAFPHHENEIAQSQAAHGQPFVNIWMHNGFVTVADEKMAKSLGNFLTIRDVLAEHAAETVRFFVLTSHYRRPLAYNEERMAAAAAGLRRLYQALRGHGPADPALDAPQAASFHAAMADDFNTPEAIAVLFDLAREINRAAGADSERAAALAALAVELGGTIGLLQADAEAYFKDAVGQVPTGRLETSPMTPTKSDDSLANEQVDSLVRKRVEARKEKNFAEADRIRDQLAEQGIMVEDNPGGTTWRRA